MLVLGLVGFALIQLWYLHKALKLADPTIVCPCERPFFSAFPVLNRDRFLSGVLFLQSLVDCERPCLFRPGFPLTYLSSPSRHRGYHRTSWWRLGGQSASSHC